MKNDLLAALGTTFFDFASLYNYRYFIDSRCCYRSLPCQVKLQLVHMRRCSCLYKSTAAACCVNLQSLCDISLTLFNGGVSIVILKASVFAHTNESGESKTLSLVWDIYA